MSSVDRVVMCVFDGLRPDMIDQARTPNLMRLARKGTWFREARTVFPSMTRVATASIATGAPPRVHGIVGNAFYYREALPEHVLDVSVIADVKRAEAATGGRFVTARTFADQLASIGKRLAVVHTGSIGSTYLINPRARANKHWTFTVFGPDASETPEAIAEVTDRFGPLPPRNLPRFEEIDYAAEVMVGHVLPNRTNDMCLVWFNEPDTSYHYKFLGSPETMAILARVDAAFGRILDWVEAQPDADRYAILAASDHGQISSTGYVKLHEMLSNEGHTTYRPAERRLDGAKVTFTGGNMGEIRILEGGTERRDEIARWLSEQPFIGALFSPARNEVEGEAPGSFAHALVSLDHARQPDLLYVLKSSDDLDPYGLPGLCQLSGGGVPVGGGMHGGVNKHELNSTLMLAAPAVAAGVLDARAASVTDIAPTVLSLLGAPRASTMTGHSLLDAPLETVIARHETGVGSFRHGVAIRHTGGRSTIERGW